MPFYYAHAKLPEINYQKLVKTQIRCKVTDFFRLTQVFNGFLYIFMDFSSISSPHALNEIIINSPFVESAH